MTWKLRFGSETPSLKELAGEKLVEHYLVNLYSLVVCTKKQEEITYWGLLYLLVQTDFCTGILACL